MHKRMRTLMLGASLFALAGCLSFDREAGAVPSDTDFGVATANNQMIETNQKTFSINMSRRFAAEVPNTVHFDFNSSVLDAKAQDILRQQADWIRQFPEIRFRVYGHTDLVGGEAYNKSLGMRRAQAVVRFLSTQGISRSRLEAVVSYGKTQPVVDVPTEDRRNRRAITDVSGVVSSNPIILNGKYAEVEFREYIKSATQIQGGTPINGKSGTSQATGGTGG